MQRMKIAVAGAGIAGMSAAWLLAKNHDVTLFERDARIGGHSNTVDVLTPEGHIPVDTGFIVYNHASYPNLVALFAHLGVETAATQMGFAVSLDDGRYEYAGGAGIRGLFGQPSNALDRDHWRMIFDIRRFFRDASDLDRAGVDAHESLGDWLAKRGYSRPFIDHHILPMAAAIWSAPPSALLAYPIAAFARFFANHGLLQVRDRPPWRTVVGGSRTYIDKLMADFGGEIRSGCAVRQVERRADRVDITLGCGTRQQFDHLVAAGHADDAVAMLADADTDEKDLLSAFSYQTNTAVLHRDQGLMPRRRAVWSSWNYVGAPGLDQVCVSYWMNALQPLKTKSDIFVTLNPLNATAQGTETARFRYAHPVFDAAALSAQRHLWRLQGRRRTWFAGSYFGSGFHEDGLQAGLWVAEQLGGARRPWSVENESSRIYGGVPKIAPPAREAVA